MQINMNKVNEEIAQLNYRILEFESDEEDIQSFKDLGKLEGKLELLQTIHRFEA